ncbi:serine/threonine-protein kinase [Arthrobacter sp. R4]|uniref:serine/threonine-protein kinase n=1 Tax=Arthrobacter sp. R4 TaxID=644417 RepID=UPI003ED981FC
MQIQLDSTWTIGSQIGNGAFGRVLEASGPQDGCVAKFIPKEPGAERELLFDTRLAGAHNVVPILDSGEHLDDWVIIMPRATRSLRDELISHRGPLDIQDAVKVLEDVSDALEDMLVRDVVHRDIKPENILLLEDKWCLADFGISRYAEASTQANTHKYRLTPAYAAPEQWRLQRATGAADMYALGVVAYELIVGQTPFATHRDLQEAHLHSPVPPSNAPGKLHYLIEYCLAKAPEARPTPADFRKQLKLSLRGAVGEGLSALENANQALARTKLELARKESEAKTAADRRTAMADSAIHIYRRLSKEALDAFSDSAGQGEVNAGENGAWTLVLGDSRLEMSAAVPAGTADLPFEVIACAAVHVRRPRDARGYEGRSHSLWYGDVAVEGQFQWFETAFIQSIVARQPQPSAHPYALMAGPAAAEAIRGGGTSGRDQLARPFTPVDVFDLDEFVQRWAGWLAAAFNGTLHSPSMLPESRPEGSWRQ